MEGEWQGEAGKRPVWLGVSHGNPLMNILKGLCILSSLLSLARSLFLPAATSLAHLFSGGEIFTEGDYRRGFAVEICI